MPMLKSSEYVRNRIQDGIKKYSRIVVQARQRGMNERDTSDIIRAMLGDMFGYDPFFDVTAEISARGPNADYAILVEGRLQFLLIAKPINCTPNAAHLLRLSGSSAPQYAHWALLTNSDTWACYRLGVGADRHAELVVRVSLTENTSAEEKTLPFYLMSKEGIYQNAVGLYWEQMRILNPGRIAALLLTEDVLNVLRRELHRTTNYRVDRQTLYDLMAREVLRPEALSARMGEDPNVPRLQHCFAYVRDPNDPSTWRLHYRNRDESPNAELLTMAVADLSGDNRALGIPADDVPLVKQRLREAYLELGVPPTDLPDLLRF